jgi:hypothetical protein
MKLLNEDNEFDLVVDDDNSKKNYEFITTKKFSYDDIDFIMKKAKKRPVTIKIQEFDLDSSSGVDSRTGLNKNPVFTEVGTLKATNDKYQFKTGDSAFTDLNKLQNKIGDFYSQIVLALDQFNETDQGFIILYKFLNDNVRLNQSELTSPRRSIKDIESQINFDA